MNANSQDAVLAADSQNAFIGELDQRFRAPLTSYFRRRVSSKTEAEDLAQDVFERVLRSSRTALILNPDALVFRIALNLLRDRARRQHSRGIEQSLSGEELDTLSDALLVELPPERTVQAQRELERVHAALGELSERTQAIFCLRRFENFKMREIAEIYGISVSAVEKHFSKALLHLTLSIRRRESEPT
jgi:RNA polymerase sigma factor (sigma-70 family)